jgi:hypothetical protein
MKHFFAILLTSVLLAPIAGSYFLFEFKKSLIRNEVEKKIHSGLSQTETMTLTFSLEDAKTKLNWKRAREIEYNGHMYDILDLTVTGDTVVYSCYMDHKETRLNYQKENLIAKALGHDPLQKQQNERVKNFFNTIFRQEVFNFNYHPVLSVELQFSTINFQFSTISLSPPSPPPKLLS